MKKINDIRRSSSLREDLRARALPQSPMFSSLSVQWSLAFVIRILRSVGRKSKRFSMCANCAKLSDMCAKRLEMSRRLTGNSRFSVPSHKSHNSHLLGSPGPLSFRSPGFFRGTVAPAPNIRMLHVPNLRQFRIAR